MELAKITSKGQITIPIKIRKALSLKDGDKVAFIEENGVYRLVNPTLLAIKEVQQAFDGFAEENNINNEEDLILMIKDIRRERKS